MATAPVKASALERAKRTLLTGVGLDVAVAVAAAVLAWLPAANVSDRTAWLVLLTAVVKTVLQAIASYVLRLRVTPAEEAPLVDGSYLVTQVGERVEAKPKAVEAYLEHDGQ